MGSPKAFLELDGEPLISRVLVTAFAGGVDRAVVVVGSAGDPELVNTPAVEHLLAERHQGIAARVVPSTFPENLDKSHFATPADYVRENARRKGAEVAAKEPVRRCRARSARCADDGGGHRRRIW
jgi:hypothetical protein